jgi:hypothetical protein
LSAPITTVVVSAIPTFDHTGLLEWLTEVSAASRRELLGGARVSATEKRLAGSVRRRHEQSNRANGRTGGATIRPMNESRELDDLEVQPGYRLAARGRERAEGERLELLQKIYDPPTRELRDFIQPGWRCLEAGVGRGSGQRGWRSASGSRGSS